MHPPPTGRRLRKIVVTVIILREIAYGTSAARKQKFRGIAPNFPTKSAACMRFCHRPLPKNSTNYTVGNKHVPLTDRRRHSFQLPPQFVPRRQQADCCDVY